MRYDIICACYQDCHFQVVTVLWEGCLGNILEIDGSVILLLDKEEPACIH